MQKNEKNIVKFSLDNTWSTCVYFLVLKKQILFLAQKFKKYIFRIISENLKSLAQKMAELFD